MNYESFLLAKTHEARDGGFTPSVTHDLLFPFQRHLVEWSCETARAAVFADCGMGKTFVQLAWADNVVRHSNGRVLILTPMSVSKQTVDEGAKLGIDVKHRRDRLRSKDNIVVTNYERLHLFDPVDFDGVVCDESSILKGFDGTTRAAVTDFMRKMSYRLLCTATAAPNDFVELGTSSEALGHLGVADMLSRFFRKNEKTFSASEEHRAGLYRFRGHAEIPFWRWVTSWARAARKPSDLGFEDSGFVLPPLVVEQHVVGARPRDGWLFSVPAVGLAEQREDLRISIDERCAKVVECASHNRSVIAWCNLNREAEVIVGALSGAVEVSGSTSDEEREEVFADFCAGRIRALVSKPTVCGFGLNFQHCAHQTFFPSHSYEQYYQSIRRSWRFGQKQDVKIDVVTTDGQANVLASLQRKSEQADEMFSRLVQMMNDGMAVAPRKAPSRVEEVPSWL